MAFLSKENTSYFWSKIKDKFVAKETGKGLSTNDFTTAEKEKLASLDPNGGGAKIKIVRWS